jgi:hypothetical protein
LQTSIDDEVNQEDWQFKRSIAVFHSITMELPSSHSRHLPSRTMEAIILMLLLQIFFQGPVGAWTSPKHNHIFALRKGPGGCAPAGHRPTSSLLVQQDTDRRRKRDVIRQTFQRVISGRRRKEGEVDRNIPPVVVLAGQQDQTTSTTALRRDDVPVPRVLPDRSTTGNSLHQPLQYTNLAQFGGGVEVLPANQTAPLTIGVWRMATTSTATLQRDDDDDDTIPDSILDTLNRRKNTLYMVPETAKTRRRNEIEEEFHNMLLHFANYTEADVLSIVDPKMRVLFEGIAASANSEPVYRAFEVLFEDLLPLRIAGRVLFKKLREFMDRSVAEMEEDIAIIVERTGLGTKAEREKLEELRLLFLTTASKLNRNKWLTSDQLNETGILSDVATRVLNFDSTMALINRIDVDRTGKLGFVELVTGLWDCASEVCGIEECDPQKVLFQVLLDLNRSLPVYGVDPNESAKDQRNRRRYDAMVANFIEWKDYMPTTKDGAQESRRMDVIRGCFVGAEIPGVVTALRVVYMDYRALRMAGDFIFSIVAKLMNNHFSKT